MALQVWLPLNGSLTNQGVGTMNITASATSSYTDGKLGKSLITGSNYLKIPWDYASEKLSIALWFKPTTPTAWSDIFSLGAGNNRFEVSTTTTYYWYGSNSYSLINPGTTMGAFNDKTWYHLAITFDGSKAKIYVNGNLSKESTQSTSLSNAFGSNKNIFIASRNDGGNRYSANMSDIRIYDNALSDREVKELSKGLVCHYTLGNIDGYKVGRNLIKNSQTNFGGGFLGSNNTRTIVPTTLPDGTSGNALQLTIDSSTNNRIYRISKVTNSTGYYTFSVWIKCVGSTECSVEIDICDFGEVFTATSEWKKIILTKNVTRYSGTYHFVDLEVYAGNSVLFWHPKLEVGSKATDWTPAPEDNTSFYQDNSVVYDTSGYENHGTCNSTSVTSNDDSPRYNFSYKFSRASKIVTPNFAFENMIQGTMSVWINRHVQDTDWRLYLYFANSYNWTSNELDFIILGSTGTNNQSIIMDCCSNLYAVSIDLNTWYHFAITWDLSTHQAKFYVNGTIKKTIINSKIDTTYASKHNSHLLGSTYDTTTPDYSMSDFRLYATALSDADIKELYDTPISLTNTGTLMTQGEYKEI